MISYGFIFLLSIIGGTFAGAVTGFIMCHVYFNDHKTTHFNSSKKPVVNYILLGILGGIVLCLALLLINFPALLLG